MRRGWLNVLPSKESLPRIRGEERKGRGTGGGDTEVGDGRATKLSIEVSIPRLEMAFFTKFERETLEPLTTTADIRNS